MILKTGVNPFGIQPPLLLALIVADKIWNDLGRESDHIHIEYQPKYRNAL